jgi:hypothetical protein
MYIFRKIIISYFNIIIIIYFNKSYTDNFFNVSKENGFLPIKLPYTKLPDTYYKLQKLIDELMYLRT